MVQVDSGSPVSSVELVVSLVSVNGVLAQVRAMALAQLSFAGAAAPVTRCGRAFLVCGGLSDLLVSCAAALASTLSVFKLSMPGTASNATNTASKTRED